MTADEETRDDAAPDRMQALEDLIKDVYSLLGDPLRWVDWAEEEISKVQRRHPAQADRIFHAFPLLELPDPLTSAPEAVMRAHFRELVERFATGGDTREATGAEVVWVARSASLVAPLSSAATLVYMRAWRRAFPAGVLLDQGDPFDHLEVESYEHVKGSEADELESYARRRLRRPERALPKALACKGLHHAEPRPRCPFVKEGARDVA